MILARIRSVAIGVALPLVVGACGNDSSDRSIGFWAGNLKLCHDTVAGTRRALNWQDQSPILKIRLHEDAARQFAEMTAKQVGKPMEFRLRGRSVMAPIIAEPVISGTLDLVGLADGDRTDVLDEVRAPC